MYKQKCKEEGSSEIERERMRKRLKGFNGMSISSQDSCKVFRSSTLSSHRREQEERHIDIMNKFKTFQLRMSNKNVREREPIQTAHDSYTSSCNCNSCIYANL